jgi:hypothetical protein
MVFNFILGGMQNINSGGDSMNLDICGYSILMDIKIQCQC